MPQPFNLPVLTVNNHVLDQAVFTASPFCDERSKQATINLLVIHSISLPEGNYDTNHVQQLFLGKLSKRGSYDSLTGVEVSSHLFIRRNGSIEQFVPFDKRAWHAGKSSFQGQEKCNDYSIGIELEGTDSDIFTNSQYSALIAVTQALCLTYPQINKNRIVGHSDIALPKGRKTDPGTGFDWERYLKSL